MNRSALPARMKYSCSVRTFPFAASLILESSSDKRVLGGLPSHGRDRRGQALCRGQPCDHQVRYAWTFGQPDSLVDLASRGPLGSAAMSRSLSRDRLLSLLEIASSKRIVVVGDAMLDVYLRGEVERISPEAPVPVVRVLDRRYALGGAANVSQNVSAVGARCDLVAAIGDDAGGRQLRSMVEAIGADVDSLVGVSRPSTVKTGIVARSQQVVRVEEEDDSDHNGPEI